MTGDASSRTEISTALDCDAEVGALATLSDEELGSRIVSMAGRLAAATCRWLLLVAAFDDRGAAAAAGMASTAHWLAFRCGLAQRTAVEHVRVARALVAHPQLASEMAAGRLSYSQARAISRVARDDERALVDELIEVARHGTVAHLEAIVRGLRTVDDVESGVAETRDEYARNTWSKDSNWRFSARLQPERGALIDSAIARLAQAEGLTNADAFVRMAEIALAALADAPDGKAARSLRGHEEAAVVIHLDASRFQRVEPSDEAPGDVIPDAPTPGEPGGARSAEREAKRPRRAEPYAWLSGGPGLPDRVVRRLLCSGRIRAIVHDGDPRHPATNVLDVGRSQRLVTDRQYRALLTRQNGRCAYPGCANTKSLDAHHRVHWLDGGRTDMSNLLLLCEPHHLGHHDGEFTIESLSRNELRFVLPDGREVGWRDPQVDAVVPNDAWLDRERPQVADDAATTRWTGQRLELGYAVSVLADRRYRAARAAPQYADA